MDTLPSEVLDQIAAFHYADQSKIRDNSREIDGNCLPEGRHQPLLTTISRRWQSAIERRSFRQICLRSSDLNRFQEVVNSYRRRFVKLIKFTIILPDYNLEACTQFEREQDRHENNAAFTSALHGLFQILHSWGSTDNSGKFYSLRLEIKDIYSPMDSSHRVTTVSLLSQSAPGARGENRQRAGPQDLKQYRYEYSSLDLLQSVDLPVVRVIRDFVTNHATNNARLIAPDSTLRIVAKLPNLRMCLLDFNDRLLSYPQLRKARRIAFAQVLNHIDIPHLIEFLSIEISPGWILNQSWVPTPLVESDTDSDSFSTSLREATATLPRLTTLHIEGILDPSLLWPTNPTPPFWQHLQNLSIHFDITSPSGEWYFQGDDRSAETYHFGIATSPTSDTHMPPGYGYSKEEDLAAALQFRRSQYNTSIGWHPSDNIFRHEPNERLTGPLIEAFARACIQIPTLKKAYLMTTLHEPVEFAGKVDFYPANWAIYYSAPGYYHTEYNAEMMAPYPKESECQRTLTFDVRGWRLNEELSELFRKIGQDKYTEKPFERYIDQWATFGKPQRLQWLAQDAR